MVFMNYYGAKDLAASFRTVRKNTITIATEIPEEHYGFRTAPDTRTVAQMLVHITLSSRLSEQIHGAKPLNTLEGFDFPGFISQIVKEEQIQRTKTEILTFLQEQGDRFSTWMEGLSDDFLAQRVSLPAGATPPSKTRFEMILGVKEHEMHHRGQLMLIERMVGVVPHLTREMQERFASMMKQKSGTAATV
jgi:uncharacterized damage-inducible protein DinB